jgi:hypothetical protein
MNQTLLNLLATADYTGLSDADAAAKLSTAVVTARPYYVSYRTLAAMDLVAADAVMGALQASHPNLAALLMQAGSTDGSAGGVDVSLDSTRAMVDQFATGGIITADQATAIKAMGERSDYPAGAPATEAEVAAARAVLAAQAKAAARRQALADTYNTGVSQVEGYEAQIAAGTVPATAPWEESA